MRSRLTVLAALAVMSIAATATPATGVPPVELPGAPPGPAAAADQPGPRLLRVEVLGERRIRLHIRSAAMRREIAIDTLVGTGPAPRPTLYLLDGVDGGPTSGWLTEGGAAEFFADKPVDVVLTTGGTASLYADWIRVDAALGLNRWETFLTEELPPIVEKYLGSDGVRAIAGVSMGAQAAMMLTQRHPGFYRGVAGLSGCYSTADQLGRAVTVMTVASRGGNPENLFGPPASPEWRAHDSLLGAEELRGTEIYLSVANGTPSGAALMSIGDSPEILAVLLGGGSLLEQGARLCTERLAARLDELDIPAVVDFLPEGMHSWPDFEVQLHRSWPTLSRALEITGSP
ncbi:alpha/beta hydrolase [Nocardia flavorosea]|uniref:Esterase family protein n=1 Tax=Nocardia flavorosea TaxID=53429 RepID=A0A846YB81_9NOCA|nr:alpha/beta hydrolase family protein [Nocardia flavorosea]NKY55024.1 esterase family protein [Nocardia flavorosea]